MKCFSITLCALLVLLGTAAADAPHLVSYQGRLTDPAGQPVPDGSYTGSFRLYDSASGGNLLWSDNLLIQTTGGLFTVLLGSRTPLDPALFADTNRYLGLAVDSDPELFPRTPMVAVPYAFSAIRAGGWVDDGWVVRLDSASDYVGIGTSSPTSPLHVKAALNQLFTARFESGHVDAMSVEYANPSAFSTWEQAVSGSAGAFGGQVEPGGLYFYHQGASATSMVLKTNGQVVVGGFDAPSGLGRFTVQDTAANAIAVSGRATGSLYNIGLLGQADSVSGDNLRYSTGIVGEAGDWGVGSRCSGAVGVKASGFADASAVECIGVDAEAVHPGIYDSYGVRAKAHGVANNFGTYSEAYGSPTCYGVYSRAYGSGSNVAVLGEASGGTSNYAGYFMGNTHVQGTLSKSAGSFKIDHPLDPEHKYLQHSFVESPDMMNIYNGNIVTGADGYATVVLPDWFGALNRDFRYQLTVIGDFAQVVVAQEVQDNRFRIRSDKPGVKVSWQVTGVRKDPYAEKNRIQVEESKASADAGKYLHPEVYGQPVDHGIGYRRPPAATAAVPASGPSVH